MSAPQTPDQDPAESASTSAEPARHPWLRGRLAPFVRWAPFVPPVVFYALAALGIAMTATPNVSMEAAPPSLLGAYLTALVMTGVATVMLYLLFCFAWSPSDRRGSKVATFALVAIALSMAVAMSRASGWLPLVGLLAHVAFTKVERLLVLAEYGCTAISLAAFFSAFERFSLFPWGIPVLLGQGFLLLLFHGDRQPTPPDEKVGASA